MEAPPLEVAKSMLSAIKGVSWIFFTLSKYTKIV